MTKCKKCSIKLKQEDKYCHKCGRQTSHTSKEQPILTERKLRWKYMAFPVLAIAIVLGSVYVFKWKNISEKETIVSEAPKQTTTMADAHNEKEEKATSQWLKTKGKEEESVSKLKEDAIQVFTTSNVGIDYDIYMIQEQVAEEENIEADIARYGDILETSQLVFYVGEKDGSVAYRQHQLEPLEFMRNLSLQSSKGNDWYAEVQFGDFNVIALYEYFDIFSYRHFHLFDLVDGELQKIQTDAMVYTYYYPIIKSLENQKLQVVLLDRESADEWRFETYEYNRENVALQFYNERTYDAYDLFESTLASIIFDHWQSHEDAYVPYKKGEEQKTWDLDEVLASAESGRFGDYTVKVGDAMIDVYDKNKSFSYLMPKSSFGITMDVSYDGYQVGYTPINEDVSYFEGELDVDFRGQVRYIHIPANYITFSMDDVYEKLGTPDNEFSADENYIEDNYYSYQLGTYNLIFIYNINQNRIGVTITDGELIDYVSMW